MAMRPEEPKPVTVSPARQEQFSHVIYTWRRWWRDAVVGTVNQAEVIAKRRDDCEMSSRYMFMIAMSAGIAILGLLLPSTAVVIGAMLLSPLMGPIMGLGFALAIGDYRWLRQSAKSLAYGSVLAVGLCAFIVLLSPLQTITPEIASRTRPSLFDLLVALFSALAGAYAMIRGRDGTIVGVAIATALMPPLAVVGFGLATFNWTVFSGALMLYITNLLVIALTAAVMARLYGFRTSLSQKHTQVQNFIIVATFVALAVPLSYSLYMIAWEANASRQIQNEVLETFDGEGRVSAFDINFDSEAISASATILTPRLHPEAETEGSRRLTRDLGVPVNLTITQYQVGTGASAAEQAALSASRTEEQADLRRADELAARLALVAGVDEDDVLIDRQRRRALVRATVLEGAGLAVYQQLEARLARTEPDWRVELVPPPIEELPDITFDRQRPANGANPDIAAPVFGPSREGEQAIEVITWAAQRTGRSVTLAGDPARAGLIAEQLREAGVQASSGGDTADSLTVRASWNRAER